MEITSEHINHFSTNGVILLKGAFSEFVEDVRNAIEENIKNPSWRERTYNPDDGGQAFFQDYVVWNKFDGYRNLVKNSKMASIAAKLMKSNTARIFHDHILVKEPGNSIVTPWHQDQPYYDIEGTQTVSFWLPLDPVPKDESIEVVAGTHQGPWMMPRTFVDKEARWFPEGTLEEVPDIDQDRDSFQIRSWELEPGDAICFSFLSLHAAPGTKKGRRTVSLRYVGEDVRRAQRPWQTSPPFPELDDQKDGLKDGDELNHPLFPVVWP